MLVEPELDAARLALDRALAGALAERIAVGAAGGPDAEAISLRALLAGGIDARQAAVLRAVWGRIDAATGLTLIATPAAQALAADRFGLAFRTVADAEAALVEAGKGSRALIDLAGPRPWWGKLLARPELRVTAALPDDRHGLPRALMVSSQTPGPTGDDRTFWVTDSALPEPRIVEALTGAGLAARPLIVAGGLKLFLLAGYVQAEDGRLSAAPGALKGVIGAAPVY